MHYPLLEKLTENNETYSDQQNIPDIKFEHVIKNLTEDLSDLLNTTISPLWEKFQESRIPYSYGIRDFSAFDIRNSSELQLLEKSIKHAISRFEPRLQNFSITICNHDIKDKTILFVLISGEMIISQNILQVSLPIKIRGKNG